MATQVQLNIARPMVSPAVHSPAATAGSAAANDEFEVLLRRLSSAKKKDVLDKIRTLDNTELIFPQIVELANTRDYSRFSQLFLNPLFDYYALAAVEQHHITPIQFGTLMSVRAGLCHGIKIEEIQVIPFFDGNAPSSRAWNYIKQTLKSKDDLSIMTDHELADFFDLMRQQEPSEKSFVVIPDRRQLLESFNNISIRLDFHANFNAFCDVEIDGRKMRMIPSIGMVKALLDATGDDGFTFKVALENATEEEVRWTCLHENARDLRVHSVIAPTPNKTDGYDSLPLDHLLHEISHLYTCRHIPKQTRKFFNELAVVVHPDRFSSRAAKQAAWEIYTTLIDLDIGYYRPDNFGKSVVNQIHIVITYILDILVPRRRFYYIFSQGKFTQEEVKECHRISAQLKEKVRGLFAVWCLYKPNYNHFEEITQYFDQLDPEEQKLIGTAFMIIQEYIFQSEIPREKFDGLSPKLVIEVATHMLRNGPDFFQLLQEGMAVGEILERLTTATASAGSRGRPG